MTVCGVLLAGGESRRFGTPKAFATYDGLPFYQRIVIELNALVNESVIVTKPELFHEFETLENVKIVSDDNNYVGMGPLAGIITAMLAKEASHYVVIACDMPLVSRDILSKLISEAKNDFGLDAMIPIVNERTQPLCAVYHSRCKETIDKQISSGRRRVIDVLTELKVRYVQFENSEEQFINVNTREDYRLIRRERD